ncbi:hypothetical protein [Vibrio lentus]|uniref:hypothetical protein n=1 Tax=Vibrio lentus TaxID=136468 RepID=UPI000C85F86F|nr:hypothetical protein [Vibrio lentus]PMM25596.1 hypothetical protein BCT58_09335 [Vibrio lentus]
MNTHHITDACLILKLLEAIEDKEFGVENAKIIAVSMCAQLNPEQNERISTYLTELSVLPLDRPSIESGAA